MSIKVDQIKVYKNGAWQDITKVHDGSSYKTFKGVYSGGVWYELDTEIIIKYGYLYNWYAVNNLSGIVNDDGSGWKIPTDEEIKTLEMYLGMSQSEADGGGYRGTNEGSKLAGNASLWTSGALTSDLEFGASSFTAIPGGFRDENGIFSGINGYFRWWSSTEFSSTDSWSRILYYDYTDIARRIFDKENGFSIRIMRGATSTEQSNNSDGDIIDSYIGSDGKEYDAILLGTQVWTIKNLTETKYSDDTNIPEITDNTNWSNDTSGARCSYNNDESNAF